MILIAAFTLLHVFFYLNLSLGWRKISQTYERKPLTRFSIVVPVRNEENNIVQLLAGLDNQDYPTELFEVIIVDDFSTDQTISAIKEIKASLDINVRIIELTDKEEQGKKHALTAGIRASEFDTILTTDADCSLSPNWIKSYNGTFDESTNMIAGPVAIYGDGMFARLQQVEFSGLMGFGAVTISHENPSMCSGANLGFRKKAFEEVGGYTDNLFIPSGDDEFLLYNIMHAFPNTTIFLKNQDAVVNTPAHTQLRSFINQRIRWTSKWKFNKNWKVRLSAILFFLDYVVFYGALVGSVIGLFNPTFALTIIALRFVSLYLFIAPINRFMKGKASFWPLLIFQIIYPMHVLFMGMNSIFGSYTWKGRKYR